MATRIAWLLNLDAELELEDPSRYRPTDSMEERIRALVPRMSMLLAQEDVVLPSSSAAEPLEGMLALAFCATPSALLRIRALGLTPPIAPALEVLARVNSRAFCAELGQTLPGARYVRSLDELEHAVREHSPTGDWLLKRDFAFAGRERRRAIGGVLDPSTLGFARRSFEAGQGLQVEPWLERRGDFAQHGYLPENGDLLIGPVVHQVCDAMGRWERSELATEPMLAKGACRALGQSVREAGKALAKTGYFGPFGVDGFRYVDGTGKLAFQPRSEINARFTMGYPRALLERVLGP